MLCEPCCDPGTQAARTTIQQNQIPPLTQTSNVSTAVYDGNDESSESDDDVAESPQTQIEPDREPTSLTDENVAGVHAMYTINMKKDASEKWGMDIDTVFGIAWKVVNILPGGFVERYNQSHPKAMLEMGDFITRVNGGPTNDSSIEPAAVFAKNNDLELVIRKGFTFDAMFNNKEDPTDPRSPAQSPRSAGNTPGSFTVKLRRQVDEKWGIDIDYGLGDSLKIVALGEKGAIKRHNDENPNRMIEVGDWICEINGEPGYAASGPKKATVLTHLGRKKLTLLIRKSFAKEGEIPVKDVEAKTSTTITTPKKEKKEKKEKVKDGSKLWV